MNGHTQTVKRLSNNLDKCWNRSCSSFNWFFFRWRKYLIGWRQRLREVLFSQWVYSHKKYARIQDNIKLFLNQLAFNFNLMSNISRQKKNRNRSSPAHPKIHSRQTLPFGDHCFYPPPIVHQEQGKLMKKAILKAPKKDKKNYVYLQDQLRHMLK